MEIKKLFSTIVIFSLVILMEVVTVNMTVNAGVNNTGAWGDNGDGTYNNPVLEADYSDPDIIRVGDDYYLVTSTFQLSPGLTILHSTDLVNWKIINSAVKDITQISSSFNYTGMNKYGRGIWAPCLTYNEKNKTFYIHFGTPDEGFFMVKTQDIYGEWSELYQLKKPDGNGLARDGMTVAYYGMIMGKDILWEQILLIIIKDGFLNYQMTDIAWKTMEL